MLGVGRRPGVRHAVVLCGAACRIFYACLRIVGTVTGLHDFIAANGCISLMENPSQPPEPAAVRSAAAERLYTWRVCCFLLAGLEVAFRHFPNLTSFLQTSDALPAAGFPERETSVSRESGGMMGESQPCSSAAFSLVEVVLALGLFAFVIVPLIGVFGGGLTIGRDAAQDSNLAQIYRQASAKVAANPTNASITPMFFTYSAEETTSGDANAIYKLTFTKVVPSDAAAGLIARNQWKLEVFNPPTAAKSFNQYFIVQSRDPAQMANEFP